MTESIEFLNSGPIIIGEIYVTPTIIGTAKNYYPADQKNLKAWNTKLMEWGFPILISPGDTLVQMCVASEEHENWGQHGGPKQVVDHFGLEHPKNLFPTVFPSHAFTDKCEGELLSFDLEVGVKYVNLFLVLAQKRSRSGNAGKFEQELKKVIVK